MEPLNLTCIQASSSIFNPKIKIPLFILFAMLSITLLSSARVITPTFNAGFSMAEQNVVNAAIDWWSIALPDAGLNLNPVAVTFQKGATPVAGVIPTASTDPANDIPGGGVAGTLFAGRPAAATMTINETPNFFFVDPTPHTEEEFTAVMTDDPNSFDDDNPFFFKNFIGNTGDAANKIDLLTVVKHELGHALGWDGDFQLFRDQMDGLFIGDDLDNQIMSTTFGLVELEGDGQAGSANESPSNNINELSHLHNTIFPNDLMNPFVSDGIRRLQSPLAIDVLGTVYGYSTDLNPIHTPEPSTVVFACISFFMLSIYRRFHTKSRS